MSFSRENALFLLVETFSIILESATLDIVVSVGVGRGWRGINDDDAMDLTPMADIVGEMAAPEIAKYLSKADAQDPDG